MRRSSKDLPHKLSGDSQKLVNIAQGLDESASRLEERIWEHHLDVLVNKLFKTNHQETIDTALQYLFQKNLDGYDILMATAEANSESCSIEQDGIKYDALLIAAPILAWTRFSIASGNISQDIQNTLATHMQAHLLAKKARMALVPTLFSIDQLPKNHSETFHLTQRMIQQMMKNSPLQPIPNSPATAPFLADTRYLLAIVIVPVGTPFFIWQETVNSAEREQALIQWKEQAMPSIARLLPGCNIELLMPEAFHVACREADKLIRPASIHAAVNYLTNTLNIPSQDLRVIIGAFSEEPSSNEIEEYRIGFALRHEPEIIYGIVWPVYEPEEDDESETISLTDTLSSGDDEPNDQPSTSIEEILTLLRLSGIVHIKRHTERFPMEFCDDCNSPLYADPDGELVHAEMPEDAPSGTEHFH